ncbi:MAG TPA: VirB8/TrbF family protein [Candidatus Saccharimonadia bacterium]|nr:VirB8/TrbF family protein [Candidatus Saccharimonadia bacterium]
MDQHESSHGQQNGFVALPPALAQYPEILAVLMRDQRVGQQAQTTSIERQAQAAGRRFYGVSGLLVVALVVIAWLVWNQRDLQPMVQVVQQTEEGRLVQVGQPLAVLAYTPEDGQWAEMLWEWLRREFWRGRDQNKEERLDRRWVDLHTCPSARGKLAPLRAARLEDKKDRHYADTTVAVDIDTVTKTPTPESFQVLWSKVTMSPESPQGKTVGFTTTFTVDRVRFTRRADVQENFLGLCVASFSTEPRKN